MALVDFGVLLGLAYQQFVDGLHDHLSAAGFDDIGRYDGYVFRLLEDRAVTVSDLASALAMTKQGAAQVVDDMEARGYVERRPHPDDARARLLHLSRRGRAALRAAHEFHRAYERRLARRLGANAVHTTRATLEEITAAASDTGVRLRPM